MICKQCQSEISDDAKFCPNCGVKIEKEEPEEKEWFFVENAKSNGKYTKAEMISFFNEGRITASTYVWKNGMDDWKHFNETELASVEPECDQVQEEHIEEQTVEKETNEFNQWYYINAQNEQVGPISENEIISLLASGTLNQNTYVWCSGMEDWEFVKNTPLSVYLKSRKTTEQPKQESYTQNTSYRVEKKSIGLYLLFSIVTCGIFSLYWLYSIARDIETMEGRKASTSPGMVVLLSLVTCGIYELYFYYKACKRIHALQFSNGYVAADDSVISLILALFGLGIVSKCIIQSTINDIQNFAQ